MATTETINILKIDGSSAITTLRELKAAIDSDKDALVALGVVEDSDTKKKQQQAKIIAKLDAELKLLNQVQAAGKVTTLEAAKAANTVTDSYYSLQKSLTTLKKAWKDMSAEERASAEGTEILNKIKQIDVQLKTLDSSIGQYQRNVGNYGQTFKESLDQAQKGAMGLMQGFSSLNSLLAMGGEKADGFMKVMAGVQTAFLVLNGAKGITDFIKKGKDAISTLFGVTTATKGATDAINDQTAATVAEATATKGATAATKAFKAALISTGIGAIVAALGYLVANLDKVASFLGLVDEEAKKTFENMKKDLEETNQIWKDQVEIMKAAGEVNEVVMQKELERLQGVVDAYWKLRMAAKAGSDEAKEAAENMAAATDELNTALHNAAVTLLGFLQQADTARAQKGMTDYEKAVANVNARFDAMRKVAADAFQVIAKITGSDTALIETWDRLEQARNDALEELAEQERKRQAQRYASAKANAEKIAKAAEDSYKTEEQLLTEKYQREKAELEKYHIDTTTLTQRYHDDLQAIRDKAAADEKAKKDKAEEDAKKAAKAAQDAKTKEIQDGAKARLDEIAKEAEVAKRYSALETEDVAEQATKQYEIMADANQRKLEALQQFAIEAEAAGNQELALQYQQQAADLSVEIELRAAEEKARIRKQDEQQRVELQKAALNATSGILGSLADIYEANGKEDKKAAKRAKALRIAGATIDMFQGATTAYATAQSLGPIAGPIIGGINAAAVITAGMANIAKIRNTDVSGESVSGSGGSTASAPAVVQAPTVQPTITEVRTLTGASEEDKLNAQNEPQRVYILESDIEAAANASRARVAETTF